MRTLYTIQVPATRRHPVPGSITVQVKGRTLIVTTQAPHGDYRARDLLRRRFGKRLGHQRYNPGTGILRAKIKPSADARASTNPPVTEVD